MTLIIYRMTPMVALMFHQSMSVGALFIIKCMIFVLSIGLIFHHEKIVKRSIFSTYIVKLQLQVSKKWRPILDPRASLALSRLKGVVNQPHVIYKPHFRYQNFSLLSNWPLIKPHCITEIVLLRTSLFKREQHIPWDLEHFVNKWRASLQYYFLSQGKFP